MFDGNAICVYTSRYQVKITACIDVKNAITKRSSAKDNKPVLIKSKDVVAKDMDNQSPYQHDNMNRLTEDKYNIRCNMLKLGDFYDG